MTQPRFIFGPTGNAIHPKENRVQVMLETEDGEIHLDLPAPGVLLETENRIDMMRLAIMAAMEKLQGALNLQSTPSR